METQAAESETQLPSNTKKKDQLYEDERERENAIHKFKFDDADLQKYSKNISDQFEIKSVFDKKGT